MDKISKCYLVEQFSGLIYYNEDYEHSATQSKSSVIIEIKK